MTDAGVAVAIAASTAMVGDGPIFAEVVPLARPVRHEKRLSAIMRRNTPRPQP
jgi:hypothetical protein